MTTTHCKEIKFDRETLDFALFLDGQLVGYARSYQEGETRLDALVYELARRAADELAYLASLVDAEQPVEALPFEPSAEELAEMELTSTPAHFAPTEAELAGVIAALMELDAESLEDARRAVEQGNADAAKLHRQAAGRFRAAGANILKGLRFWHLPDGLLIESASGGAPYRVTKQGGEAYSPIGCSCPHGVESKAGLCWHAALLIGSERRAERLTVAA